MMISMIIGKLKRIKVDDTHLDTCINQALQTLHNKKITLNSKDWLSLYILQNNLSGKVPKGLLCAIFAIITPDYD